ncbi:MAG TPA: glycosyltransferase family 4 protein [Vicinamibacterales bacterium]|nr:glycosyltransferase family 4 protein [Vicinamibacterales bacterium]
MRRSYRLAYLVSHPIQYQAPLLRRLAAHPDIDLTVFFLSDLSVEGYRDPGFGVRVQWDVPLLSGYRHVFLPAVGGRDRLSRWRPLSYGLRRYLESGAFDVLWVHGYSHQVCLRAVAVAKAMGIKVLLRGESHLQSGSASSSKRLVKAALLRSLFGLVDGFLAIGTRNKEYYLRYGVPRSKIFMMPYAVDNDFFRREAEKARLESGKLRAELKLEAGRPVIVFAGKLQPRKRPTDLLEAYAHLSPDGVSEPIPYLLFVGDGEERTRLEERARQLGWSSIRFVGFRNQSQIPSLYAIGDVLALPSDREPWGLVVNEAMNAGLAIIVSDRVGCSPDLVKDGVNGFVFPVGDVTALAGRLREVTSDAGRAREMGAASLRIISAWDFEADVQGLLAALEFVLD